MPHLDRTVLELRAGALPQSDLRVRRVCGNECLSAPYDFTVDFVSASGDFLEWKEQAGAEALLTLRRPGGSERYVHGVLWRIDLTGVAADKPSYRVRIVPKLERLKHVKRSRIFQARTVPDIVKEVLSEHEVEHRLSLTESHAPREYCVQHQELDFTFISRLLESEGIFYWFEHGPNSHVMVLADSGKGCTELPNGAEVLFKVPEQVGDSAEDEHLYRLKQAWRARTDQVELKDYDYERPEMVIEGRNQTPGPLGAEVYEYPGGFKDWRIGSQRARLRLEELRLDAETWSGEGTCLRFFPGAKFQVGGHEDASYNQKLLLVEVQHVAEQQDEPGELGGVAHGYRNAFMALEAGKPCRPRRRTPRPVARSTTARVVGPAGEEVWVDQGGRVKVQFLWDRDGKSDDRSSCWVRVGQAWTGAAWGAQFVPRIGQEVLVKFQGGDPDQPFVAGAIYNGWNRPPIELPHDKSKSTIKSDSSLGGGGSNELRFEDAKDLEEIYLHAQKEENIEIRHHKTQRVRAKESLQVDQDRSIEVKGNQQLKVEKDDGSVVGLNQTLAVTGDRTMAVTGSHGEHVGGMQAVNVSGFRAILVKEAAMESVGAAAALTIGAAYAIHVVGATKVAVGGVLTRQVGGARIEKVGAARAEQVGDDSSAQVGGDFATEVKGQIGLVTGKNHQEDVSGKSEVDIAQPVTWMAKEFQLDASKLSLVVGSKRMLSLDQSGSVKLGASKMTVDGRAVQIKGASVSKVAGSGAQAKQVRVKQLKKMKRGGGKSSAVVKGADGKPMANVRWRAKMPDGSVVSGRTDGAGRAAFPAPEDGEIELTFPDLDDSAWS